MESRRRVAKEREHVYPFEVTVAAGLGSLIGLVTHLMATGPPPSLAAGHANALAATHTCSPDMLEAPVSGHGIGGWGHGCDTNCKAPNWTFSVRIYPARGRARCTHPICARRLPKELRCDLPRVSAALGTSCLRSMRPKAYAAYCQTMGSSEH